jgi:hypothetical protein
VAELPVDGFPAPIDTGFIAIFSESFMSVPDTPLNESKSRPEYLPPVTPPTATFLIQLFLIPMLIVSIIVVLWLLFSWVAHMGRDNAAELVKAIVRDDTASWQRAYELADLLRSPDPKYAALRQDSELAQTLAKFLERDLKEPLEPLSAVAVGGGRGTYSGSQAPAGSARRAQIMRRMYLCRSLGSFSVQDGIPVLLKAATQEQDPIEVQVRFAAIEAISTLADNCGPNTLQENDELMKVLLDASQEPDDSGPPPAPPSDDEPTLYRPHAELRAVAAYALGVIGGERATKRLVQMLHDTYPNARYNAATGLARQGNGECIGVLREMLDPENPLAIKDEIHRDDQARKRTTVLMNGIKSTIQLGQANPELDLSNLDAALEDLAKSPLEKVLIERGKVKNAAAEARRILAKKQSPAKS